MAAEGEKKEGGILILVMQKRSAVAQRKHRSEFRGRGEKEGGKRDVVLIRSAYREKKKAVSAPGKGEKSLNSRPA